MKRSRLRRTPALAAALLVAAALLALAGGGAPQARADQPAPLPAPALATPLALPPAADEKAATANLPATPPAPAIAVSPQSLSAPGLQACGSPAVGSTQPITSSTFIAVASCSLTVPTTSTVLLRGTSSLGLAGGGADYEAYFRLGYDTAALASTNRFVNVYASPGDGTDQGVALDALVTVAPGAHTFKLFVRRYGGTGPIQLTSPAIVATLLTPASGALACASSSLPAWETSSATLADVVTCTLTAPSAGTVQVSASTSAGLGTGGQPFEAAFQLAADGADLAATRRKVDVALDSGDGSDRALATGATLTVGPGAHTFTLRGQLVGAAGPTARAYAPVVTALFTPLPPGPEVVCGSPDTASWTSASASPVAVASCSLTVPVTSTVLLDASASAGIAGGGAAYEALFTLGVDGGALAGSQRRVDVLANSGDGADTALAAGLATTVGPGAHTFTLYGQVTSGSGPAALLAPHLAAAIVTPLPTVSDIADQAGLTGIPIGPLVFTVGSPRIAPEELTVVASSSDPVLIPPDRIVLEGTGASRAITLTPGTAKVGSARVTITVSDGDASSSVSFLVTVSAAPVHLPLVVR